MTISKSMPTWVANHVVTAFKIGKIEGCTIYAANDPELFVEVAPEFIASHPLNIPGYLVVQAGTGPTYMNSRLFEFYFKQTK